MWEPKVVNKFRFFVLSAFFALSGVEARAGFQAIGVYGTGLDANGALLGAGAVDPHYSLATSVTPNTAPNAYVVSPLDPNWVKNTSTSQWINALGKASTEPNGLFTYTTTFTPAGLDPTTASLSGKIAADDQVVILLNGQSTGITVTGSPVGHPNETPDYAYTQFYNFSIAGGFQSGVNTLTFEEYNNHGGPAGLQVQISGTANAVPEPASLAMLGVGLVSAGLVARRRRQG